MAGLVAAARLRELGADVDLYEKGSRPGGSMALSSCVVWRYREFERFRADCPHGDERLQRLVWERFDEAIAWLERLGPRIVWQETKNPRTTGRRYDPRSLTDVLVRGASDVHYGERWGWAHMARLPLVLATGGFPVRLARERGLLVRSNPWSEGDGLDTARARDASTAGDLEEFYGRAMPAPPARIAETDYVRLAQVWGGRARAVNDANEEFFRRPPAWHENDVVQAIARQPGATAWYALDTAAADEPQLVAAREAGATVLETDGEIRLRVAAAVTHTLGGIRVDERARVVDDRGAPIDGLFAAGVDVGGIANGGYASGLAQALVLGLVAAESALEA